MRLSSVWPPPPQQSAQGPAAPAAEAPRQSVATPAERPKSILRRPSHGLGGAAALYAPEAAPEPHAPDGVAQPKTPAITFAKPDTLKAKITRAWRRFVAYHNKIQQELATDSAAARLRARARAAGQPVPDSVKTQREKFARL